MTVADDTASGAVRTRIAVISLDDAAERRSAFTALAPTDGLPWAFFDAHRGAGAHLDYRPAQALQVHGRELKTSELGCYSSHSALWEQLAEDGAADQYIVLEDDVMVDWAALTAIARHDFGAAGHHYVRLFGRKPSRFIVKASNYLPGPRALIAFTGKPFGTQGYVITRAGAAAMLAACRCVVRPIDDQMDRFWEHGIPNLALFPFPIIERLAPSTIGAARFAGGRKGRSRIARWRDDLARRVAVLRYRFWGIR